MTIRDYSATANDNSTIDGIGLSDAMLANALDDAIRAQMADSANFLLDLAKPTSTTGSANIYALSTGGTVSAYEDKIRLLFKASFSNTGPCKINIDILGNVNLNVYTSNGAGNPRAGQIQSGGIYDIIYVAALSAFVVLNPSSALDPFDTVALLLADATLTTANTPVGTIIYAQGFRYQVVASGGDIQNSSTAQVQLKYLKGNSYNLRAFGGALDGVTDDSAAWASVIAAYKVSPAPILLDGFSYVTSPIVYQTSGTADGLAIEGVTPDTCGIIGDFTGDTLLDIDGSSLLAGKFQHYGGLMNLSLLSATGSSIVRAIRTIGWWRAEHSNVIIGTKASRMFTGDGIAIPLDITISSNVDFYASVSWKMTRVQVLNCGGSGIKGYNNQGHASWHLDLCTFEENAGSGIEVHAAGWKVSGGSASYNDTYGIDFSGETGVTLANGDFSGVELDGNTTANIYISRVSTGKFSSCRCISRLLDGVERALDHVLIDNSQVCLGVTFEKMYHRTETSITSPVTLYNSGAASTNVAGNIIDGYSLLNSSAGGVTDFSAGLLDQRFKNTIWLNTGVQVAGNLKKYLHSSATSQAITTTATVWKFNLSPQPTGWTDYDTTTGVLTAPFKGFYRVYGNFTCTIPIGARVILNIRINGTSVRSSYWDWSTASIPDRFTYQFNDLLLFAKGDLVDLEVISTVGPIALSGIAKIYIEAV